METNKPTKHCPNHPTDTDDSTVIKEENGMIRINGFWFPEEPFDDRTEDDFPPEVQL